VSAISKRGTKTVEIAERHVASIRSALLRVMQSTAEEIRVAKNVFHAWVLKTKIGAIWAQRLDEKSRSAAEPHQAISFPCPRCGLTLHLKGEDPSHNLRHRRLGAAMPTWSLRQPKSLPTTIPWSLGHPALMPSSDPSQPISAR